VIALLLHGSLAIWLTLPTPEPFQETPELRINLLAAIAETTVNTPIETPPTIPEPLPEQALEPMVEQTITPPHKPEPAPRAEIQETLPEPEPAETPKPIQEIVPPTPTEPNTEPLDAVATAQYEQLLVAWLEKHKKYPRRAKRLRIEGQGKLRILIDRTGQLQHVTLEQRTGNKLLDKAILKMAEQANPFPPMPESDLRQKLEFIVPVIFALR